MSCLLFPYLVVCCPLFLTAKVQESDPTSCMSIGHILEPAKRANRGHLSWAWVGIFFLSQCFDFVFHIHFLV